MTQATLTTTDERPDECECWNPTQTLPCWSCYRAGFTTANPNAGGDDE